MPGRVPDWRCAKWLCDTLNRPRETQETVPFQIRSYWNEGVTIVKEIAAYERSQKHLDLMDEWTRLGLIRPLSSIYKTGRAYHMDPDTSKQTWVKGSIPEVDRASTNSTTFTPGVANEPSDDFYHESLKTVAKRMPTWILERIAEYVRRCEDFQIGHKLLPGMGRILRCSNQECLKWCYHGNYGAEATTVKDSREDRRPFCNDTCRDRQRAQEASEASSPTR